MNDCTVNALMPFKAKFKSRIVAPIVLQWHSIYLELKLRSGFFKGIGLAFVVCYSWSPPDDHTRHGAIYLDQQFYEFIWHNCRSESRPYSVLREIALLQFKSPTLVISGDR